MRKRHKVILSLLLIVVSSCLISSVTLANTLKATGVKTELNIQVSPNDTGGSSDSSGLGDSSEIKNSSQVTYTPAKATNVQNLPQTGEIITSFIYIILGLSLLMFVVGILINKYTAEDYIEMETTL